MSRWERAEQGVGIVGAIVAAGVALWEAVQAHRERRTKARDLERRVERLEAKARRRRKPVERRP
jgi:hypothetical protein